MLDRSFFLALAVCGGVAGCSGETDPYKANAFDNLNNLARGTYKAEQARIDQNNDALRAQNASTTAEIQNLEAVRAANARRIGSMSSELAEYRSQLARLRAQANSDAAALEQLSRAEAEINRVEQNAIVQTDEETVADLDKIRALMRQASNS